MHRIYIIFIGYGFLTVLINISTMSKEVYDLPPERQRVLRENAQRRLELRNYFLKEQSNPFKHATGETGHVFDPAIQRYLSLKVTEYERFKPNLKTFKWPLMVFIIPYALITYGTYKERSNREARYRNGEVAYKDRNFKFL